jgi:hypothetical protein
VDASGNVWTVSNGQVYENGALLGSTQNVILLMYFNGFIYQQNSTCGIWYASGSSWKLTQFPSGVTNPVASQCPNVTIVPPSSTSFFDSQGNSWSIVGGQVTSTGVTGGQIYENGALSPNTANVILLMYFNGVVYQQNSACAVYQAANNSWIKTTYPGGASIPADVGYTCPGFGGVWTDANGTTLITSTQTLSSESAYGNFNVYYDSSSCGSFGQFAGNLAITQSTIGENPLQLAGAVTTNADVSSPATGQLQPGSSLSLSVSGCSSTTWAFNGGLYNQPSSLALIAGSWFSSIDDATLVIDSTGAITEPDVDQGIYAGCTPVSGQVSLINPNYNLYSFTLSYGFTQTCRAFSPMGQTFTGFLTLDQSSTPNVLLGGGRGANDSGGFSNNDFNMTRQ